jgi:deoxyribodipyrimidine photo-lyase
MKSKEQDKKNVVIFWFRRDLRLNDNHGFYHALNSEYPVLPVFIFDKDILGRLNSGTDARVSFIYDQVHKLKTEFEKNGGSLLALHDKPLAAFSRIIREYEVKAVTANKDYESYARKRDGEIRELFERNGVEFTLYKDHVIFEESEIVKDNGEPYTVFTPYSKRWKETLNAGRIDYYPSEKMADRLLKTKPFPFIELSDLGFKKSNIQVPPPSISRQLIEDYGITRDFPTKKGTTRLGIHLRFGTVSIRELTGKAMEWSGVFLNELIWRNFFSTILWHYPYVEKKAFKIKYDLIQWRNNEDEFAAWCNGHTGYPLVDAGMRELNATGFMHNRVRMVTASFLTKHLLIDWRWGELYFADKLLDFDLASNNGNWQWAAGSGCDAAPYFRIFNPALQQQKFDPDNEYVKRWVPEAGTSGYVNPVVDHREARERALKAYKGAGI